MRCRGQALHHVASRHAGRRLCAIPDRLVLQRPDPGHHARPGSDREGHGRARRGDPQISGQRVRQQRQAEDRSGARPAGRQEMQVGRYYLEKHDYTGAINRFKVVVTKYQTTRHVEEALERLTESYMALGIIDEAQTAAAVLGHNFPDSSWYKHAYALVKSGGREPSENKGSWISKAFKKVGLG